MLQVCLNGPRTRAEHPSLPVSADELAPAAASAVAAGAADVHLHPKTPDGRDSMAAAVVAEAVSAVRSAVPGVTVGVTTGAWTASTVERVAQVRAWTVLPDHASVNWHEDSAEELAAVLLHGEESAAWPVLRRAEELGLDTRIGFEDTLVLPDGTPAPSNAALVRAALELD